MSPLVLLRIAAIVAFLFALGHTLGAPWTPGGVAEASAVIGSMKAAVIPGIEPARSYWDFYFGFGLSISVYLLALAAMLWHTASLARHAVGNARPFMVSLFVCYLAVCVVAVRYFFYVPALMAGAVCFLIALAWWVGRRERRIV